MFLRQRFLSCNLILACMKLKFSHNKYTTNFPDNKLCTRVLNRRKNNTAMKQLFLLYLSFMPFLCPAQKIEKQLTPKPIGAGTLANGTAVAGTEIKHPHKLVCYDHDAAANELLLVYQKATQGYFALLDLNTQKLRWHHPITSNNFQFAFGQNTLTQNQYKKGSVSYDRHTGEVKWENENAILWADKKNDVGILATGDFVNLTTGVVKWGSHIDAKPGTLNVSYIDEDNIALSGNGVYSYNLATGQGWEHYDEKTQKMGKGRMIAVSAMGGGMGLIFTSREITQTQSNIVADAGYIYYATNKNLYCFDKKSGEIKWVTDIMPAGNSRLFVTANNVVLLNNGWAYRADEGRVPYQQPYIATYNKTTGKQGSISDFKRGQQVFASQYSNDTILFNCNNELLYAYNANNGAQIDKRNLQTLNLSPSTHVADVHKTLTKNANGKYIKLADAYPGDIFIIDKEVKIYRFLPGSKAEKFEGEFWIYRQTTEDIDVYSFGDKTLLLKAGHLVATLDMPEPVFTSSAIVGIGEETIRIVNRAELYK